MIPRAILTASLCTFALVSALPAQTGGDRFQLGEVFDLEYASDPQISPDGRSVVYVRNSFDIMTDRRRSRLWIVNADGSDHRALTATEGDQSSPRWSPDGMRLLFVLSGEDTRQIRLSWLDTGQETPLAELAHGPGNLVWSPDGRWIAFTMFVPAEPPKPMAEMPRKPEGADWGPPIKLVDEVQYRADGRGYLEDGYTHVFVLPAEGGTPRQLTSGPFNHSDPVWTPDGRSLIISANRHEDWEYDPRNSELFEVMVASAAIRPLTDRYGPDGSPAVSPDGRRIAYLGFDDELQGYQVTRLYVMDRDGAGSRVLAESLDRDIEDPAWSADGRGLFFQFDDEGNTNLAYVPASGGEVKVLAGDLGGLSLGRPYSGGAFSVARNGSFAFTHSRPDHPADVAVGREGREARRVTDLNRDLLGHKQLGEVEEIWYESSYDGRRIQGWIARPPDFDPGKKYPLILEIHGGPFANYGDRFAAEIQLYAAAGYVVLYTNPRGSTSYGEEFGNLIHHAYPSQDYDDLMSGVDAVLAKGYVDENNLFVTGGSGGGVLSAWIVGHTDRFRAAVVQKPVINWYSFVLTSDGTPFFYRYWFPGFPWDNLEHYMARSPISYAGNVSTPTMLITGEVDYRTPMPETEQFYQALRLRKVPTAMVRVPDASHGIAAKPSNLIAKVAHVLAWFDRYRSSDEVQRATEAGDGR